MVRVRAGTTSTFDPVVKDSNNVHMKDSELMHLIVFVTLYKDSRQFAL